MIGRGFSLNYRYRPIKSIVLFENEMFKLIICY
jgi:hypothetical protein